MQPFSRSTSRVTAECRLVVGEAGEQQQPAPHGDPQGAADDPAVAGVQFLLDGAEDSAPQFRLVALDGHEVRGAPAAFFLLPVMYSRGVPVRVGTVSARFAGTRPAVKPSTRMLVTVLNESAAGPERVQSAQQMRFESVKADLAQLSDSPPPDSGEFTLVGVQGLPRVTGEGKPEADVCMPHLGFSYCFCHREEERPVAECRA